MKEIYLTGTIWNGTFDWVKWQVEDMPKGEQLVIWLNSPGGSLLEGVAVYNYLLTLDPKPIIKVFGLAGSAASVIACAGTVEIAETAFFFVHNALYNYIDGNADELRQMADDLDKYSASIIAAYARKTGKPGEELKTLMDQETLLTAQEAVDWGFADSIYTMDAATNLQLIKIAANYTDSISMKLNNVKPNEVQTMTDVEMKAQLDAMNAKTTSLEALIAEKDTALSAKDKELADVKALVDAQKAEASKLQTTQEEMQKQLLALEDSRILAEETAFVAALGEKLKIDEREIAISKLVALRKSNVPFSNDKSMYTLEREQLSARTPAVTPGSTFGNQIPDDDSDRVKQLQEYYKEKR